MNFRYRLKTITCDCDLCVTLPGPRLEVVRTEVVRSPSPGLGRTTTDVALRKVIEEKTKIEGELVSLTSKVRSLENELSAKNEQVGTSVFYFLFVSFLFSFHSGNCQIHKVSVPCFTSTPDINKW